MTITELAFIANLQNFFFNWSNAEVTVEITAFLFYVDEGKPGSKTRGSKYQYNNHGELQKGSVTFSREPKGKATLINLFKINLNKTSRVLELTFQKAGFKKK